MTKESAEKNEESANENLNQVESQAPADQGHMLAEHEETPLASAEEKVTELNDKLLRLAAEFENYRKRSERDKLDAVKYANERVMRELLPVLDSLDRALAKMDTSHLDEAGQKAVETVLTGVKMVDKQFHDTLARFGIHPFDSLHQKFDPNKHEAIQRREDSSVEEDTVIEEYQKGYTLNGRLVRPARVVVSKKRD